MINFIVLINAGQRMGAIQMEKNEENKYCKRCHRELKNIESKELGFGKTCYHKYINRKRTYLFEIEKNKGGIISGYTTKYR